MGNNAAVAKKRKKQRQLKKAGGYKDLNNYCTMSYDQIHKRIGFKYVPSGAVVEEYVPISVTSTATQGGDGVTLTKRSNYFSSN